jgi:hypothetical protein
MNLCKISSQLLTKHIQHQQTLRIIKIDGMEIDQCSQSDVSISDVSVGSSNENVASACHVAVSKVSSKTILPSVSVPNIQNTIIIPSILNFFVKYIFK